MRNFSYIVNMVNLFLLIFGYNEITIFSCWSSYCRQYLLYFLLDLDKFVLRCANLEHNVGHRKAKNQLYASFSSDGRHVVSVGEDSNVYIWSYDVSGNLPCRGAKLIRSSEFFFSKGASIAVPWPGMGCNYREAIVNNSNHISCQPQKISEQVFRLKNPDCLSLGAWPFSDGSSRVSATWPEEKLSLQTKPRLVPEDCHQQYHHLHHDYWSLASMASTWNSVIVTAGDDGAIRSFHNFGLPIRL